MIDIWMRDAKNVVTGNIVTKSSDDYDSDVLWELEEGWFWLNQVPYTVEG